MLPSLIRTLVPLVVQFLVAQLAARGIDAGPYSEILAQVVGGLVAAGYYAAVRFLESHRKAFGWLLGLPSAPSYDPPASADGDVPVVEDDVIPVPAVPASDDLESSAGD